MPPEDSVRGSADWLIDELTGLTEAPIVIGHSLGGAVALRAALDRPELFSGLVLVNSSARLKVHPAILAQAEAAVEGGAPVDISLAFANRSPAMEGYIERSAQTPVAAACADWRACNDFDVRDQVGGLGVASLVLYGTEDKLTPPKFQKFLVENISNVRERALPGVGHMAPWEAPTEFWAEVHRLKATR